MNREVNPADELIEATRSRAKFSGHGSAKGAAGYRTEDDGEDGSFLSVTGDTAIVNPHEHGYGDIRIGAAWDNISPKQSVGLLQRLLKKAPPSPQGVDLDLGVLYELKNGARGAVQAFGELFGDFEAQPYMALSGDERTGDAEGDDEFIMVNGAKWPEIKRLLVYVYIYGGAPDWAAIRPQVHVDVPGEQSLIIVPSVGKSELPVCAVAGLENIRNGIRLTNYNEYFRSHPSMDRAFGFGLQWDDGAKE